MNAIDVEALRKHLQICQKVWSDYAVDEACEGMTDAAKRSDGVANGIGVALSFFATYTIPNSAVITRGEMRSKCRCDWNCSDCEERLCPFSKSWGKEAKRDGCP